MCFVILPTSVPPQCCHFYCIVRRILSIHKSFFVHSTRIFHLKIEINETNNYETDIRKEENITYFMFYPARLASI